MRIRAALHTVEGLATARRAGALRRQAVIAAGERLATVAGQVDSGLREALGALGNRDTGTQGMASLVAATDGALGAADVIANALLAQERSDEMVEETRGHLRDLDALRSAEVHPALMTEEAIEGLEQIAGDTAGLDVSAHADVILERLVHAPSVVTARGLLRNWMKLRLWALHGAVLHPVADTQPDADATDHAAVAALRTAAEQRARALRDAIRAHLRRIQREDRAMFADTLALQSTLLRAEEWLLDEAGSALAAAAALAAGQAGGSGAVPARVARDAALAYDAVRHILAFTAGGWRAFLALTTGEEDAVADLADAADLPISSATLDLPRSTIAEAAGKPSGSIVEVAGLITALDVTVGGPAPRSVLTLDGELTILAPFTAVDSFGVTADTWAQVRGEVFADGKDSLSGPLVMVRRVRRGDAATQSWTDALVFAGRALFELRPAGLDLVTGRMAGVETTLNELTHREPSGEFS